jgi:flavin reductase (DIM6/NTAB) family NADH-FMN oxidoreductase RutF
MMKITLGAKNCLYPMPTTVVGANVGGKPNFITIAHVGIMDHGSISLSMNKLHYTNAGIKENKTFSVNIPSVDMVKETDHCGLVSGKVQDKSRVFEYFYGKLKSAPMIKNFPINMECELIKTVDMITHDVFIGRIVETFCEDSLIVDGVVDISRVRPILFAMNDRSYWEVGRKFAKAWDAGKDWGKT